jgi:tetratricopeptide (TPR) repeat protein
MKNAIYSTLLICISLILSCLVSSGATLDELVKQGDVYDKKFNPKEALKSYLPAEALAPNNVDLLLRIARQYRHDAADQGKVAEKIRLSALGLSYARRAVALAPKSSEANLSVAISHAKGIELHGNKEKMEALRQAKAYADKAIALDSKNDLAWYVLGRWHQKVAELGTIKLKFAEFTYGSLPKASNDDAIKCFRKAISINPNTSPYCIDLGIVYAATGNPADARKQIETGLAMPNKGKDDAETKKRGREILLTLK